jgi:hypothetical protein
MEQKTAVTDPLTGKPCATAIYRQSPDSPGVLVGLTWRDGVNMAIVAEGERKGETFRVQGTPGTYGPVPKVAG